MEVRESDHAIKRSMGKGIVYWKEKGWRYRLADLDHWILSRREIATRLRKRKESAVA